MGHVANEDLPVPPNIPLGIYKHYRGDQYEVLGVALDSETLEPMVVYKPLYESKVPYWVRPYKMFTETVDVDGVQTKRFQQIA